MPARLLPESSRTGSEGQNDTRSSDCTNQLCDTVKDKPDGLDHTSEEESEADIRIEQSAGNSEEQPGGD